MLITQPPLGGWSPSYSEGVLGGTRAVGVGRNAPALILFFSIMEVENRRGVALGVEFEIGKGGHLRPLAATCRKRPLAATRGHLPKAATCGHLPSAATCGHLRPLALCGHLRSLAATCPLRPLAVTCGHLPSAVTCGHLRSLGRFGRSLAPAAEWLCK